MKHLKRFNEAVELDEYEFEKFMNDNLAFIIDDGFRFTIKTSRVYGPTKCYIDIIKGTDSFGHCLEFKWDEIKYDIIQFIELLNDNFILNKNWNKVISIYSKDNAAREYTIDEFLDDDTKFLEDITCISFVVVGKK